MLGTYKTVTGIAYSEFSEGGERSHDSLDLDDDQAPRT
jgi:hypothetical protein